MYKIPFTDKFVDRHIGPGEKDVKVMLEDIGVNSVDELIEKTIPAKIRLGKSLEFGEELTEHEFLAHLKEIASKNKVFKSFIGMGYYDTITPSPIIRNILENPGWYTQYTPYQAEISQGRLEALLNYQTMITDLTSMDLANASLLDEATAAAETMLMFYNMRKKARKNSNVFLVADNVFPQTIDVLRTRAVPFGIELKIVNVANIELSDDIFGMLVQYPGKDGKIVDYKKLFEEASDKTIYKAVAADLMSLALLKAPGEIGADAVIGTNQRFGVPLGFGGPHAGYFATRNEYKRNVPGRIIGVSVDKKGRRALRMALQTREQHIKREKATSNICTAQVLLAIISSMYAVYHGPKGIKAIATRIHTHAKWFVQNITKLGYDVSTENYFDTVVIKTSSEEELDKIRAYALSAEINAGYFEDNQLTVSFGETITEYDIFNLVKIFAEVKGNKEYKLADYKESDVISDQLKRVTEYLTHPVFNTYHSETDLMRYMKSLERKDLSLTSSMIPLGSCTMKLNAATEMFGITWPEFSKVHPFVPQDQAEGYHELVTELEKQLNAITGFAGTSVQPNSGAQGEYAGLLVIKVWHENNDEHNRNVVLIPSSAHGTNPASAVMAGGKVVIVKCDDLGNIDVDDLKAKAEMHKDNLMALMVTYPSTHGVFEEEIKEICDIIHVNGGQVYMDGANMNAQVGYTNPQIIGADVCHLNLHKTFSIPHGGGGPGVGSISVAEHLVPFLPGHVIVKTGGDKAINAVSAAPYGSSSVLPISYAYIKMMGGKGLTDATAYAILNANYIRTKLKDTFPVLYTGKNGFVGHELIFDFRHYKHALGIEVEDIAKRLMDYGFHAPTVSFPVPGTLMVEPTESESKAELDRFIETMKSIRIEIAEIENGNADKENNVLKNAPHPVQDLVSDKWDYPYSREKAAYPVDWLRVNKFWPATARVDNAFGDRNLVCACIPTIDYEE